MSSDLPENLQVIKVEQPSSPEKCTNQIKERLNLHVKRRLQQDSVINQVDELETHKRKGNQKDTSPKTRRPYQKRTDKLKPENSSNGTGVKCKKSSVGGGTVVGASNALNASPADLENNLDDSHEQDIGHETESKNCTNRDKEKCPDILSMVLSVKKRAIMQDPEVQQLLTKIMEVVKN